MDKTQAKKTEKKQNKKKKIQQQSIQQQIMKQQLENIQNQRLNRVFQRICGFEKKDQKKPDDLDQNKSNKLIRQKDKFNYKDLSNILTQLKYPINKPQIQQMIWEVDQDLDGCVNFYQFQLMYKRCIFDKTGLQPRNLFNLVQFLMYDKSQRGRITVEDTLQLIYVRYRQKLDQNIRYIFGDKQKTEDGQERQISFQEYLEQIRKRDLQIRKKLQAERKQVKIPKNE